MNIQTLTSEGERIRYAEDQVRPSLRKKLAKLGYTLKVWVSYTNEILKFDNHLSVDVTSSLWKFSRRVKGHSLKKLDQAVKSIIAEIEEGAFTTISAREHITYKNLLKNMVDKFDLPTIYTWLDEVLEETQ